MMMASNMLTATTERKRKIQQQTDDGLIPFKRNITEEQIETMSNLVLLTRDEDITLIWFDENIEQEITGKLNETHDHIQFYLTFELLNDAIAQVKNEKILLIVCGKYSHQTLTSMHDHEKIHSIYIFCIDKQSYQNLVDDGSDKKCSKLVGIYIEYDQLFEQVGKQVIATLKHLSTFL
ncbi:unnamed protein product [Didymodactylos carnosus]|uniref:Uncharacterized protein n=1 Tax=Didymodactylos carnosus TaxID=1234261 RepID=A0A814PUE2_9BILA|nr:unnamed protein product [Didymodactylos carnosus]CAF3874944.1 unnamed protein product [Didymodactylos carnosus]